MTDKDAGRETALFNRKRLTNTITYDRIKMKTNTIDVLNIYMFTVLSIFRREREP